MILHGERRTPCKRACSFVRRKTNSLTAYRLESHFVYIADDLVSQCRIDTDFVRRHGVEILLRRQSSRERLDGFIMEELTDQGEGACLISEGRRGEKSRRGE